MRQYLLAIGESLPTGRLSHAAYDMAGGYVGRLDARHRTSVPVPMPDGWQRDRMGASWQVLSINETGLWLWSYPFAAKSVAHALMAWPMQRATP